MAKHLETGKRGEDLAGKFLQNKGYEILERNWRFSWAEIDIIAKHEEALVFVEVKTRSSDHFGKPESFVTPKKEKLMGDAAAAYMEAINHQWEIRFDIVSVLLVAGSEDQIEHFEDAFFPGWS